MALELKQSLRLSQQLVMTPQLQQAIKLLQLNRLELAEHCMTEMLENPILEESSEEAEEIDVSADEAQKKEKIEASTTKALDRSKGEGTDDINWENYVGSSPRFGSDESHFRDIDPDLPSFESTLTRAESLADHLTLQLTLLSMESCDQKIAEEIIGNLDEDGYLRIELSEIAQDFGCSTEAVETVLRRVQELDPIGVGARNLAECLLVQARQMPESELMCLIIQHHLSDLERQNHAAIAKALNVSLEEVSAAAKRITSLEPKPGRQFYDESFQYITPDIYVYKAKDDYLVVLNEDGLPKLRISHLYQNLLRSKGASSGLAKEYVHEKLRSAIWLIRSIHQRQRTIYRVTQSIVKMQKDFLEKGISHLRPMVLRDIAQDIGMHESTVSRVTSNKYVHTPQGLFELKFFFNSGIRRVEGLDVASEAVKDRIKAIIVTEDLRRPYSDQEIVELLRKNNIDIARRTVAKYREMLGILSSSKRKRFF